jgi:hypothetical protein
MNINAYVGNSVRTVRERVLSSGPKSLSIMAWLLALVLAAPARALAAAPPARISYGSCKPGTSFEQYAECTRRSHSSPSFRLLAGIMLSLIWMRLSW